MRGKGFGHPPHRRQRTGQCRWVSSQFQDGSHRLNLGAQPTNHPTIYNANGQPERLGQREYVWDALDLPPASRTKLKLVKSVNHQENDGHEEEQI
jgi:hypothetical protein